MSYVDPNTVKLITEIAEGLPPDMQEELLLMVSTWKVDSRNAERWHFVEVLNSNRLEHLITLHMKG